MLQSHLDAVEQHLLSISNVPANSGHSLHKGTPREAFIREFLENHLSQNVAIGSGEIIDAESKPNESRNQYDIIIYKKNYPKISFGGGVDGFLAESVVATIEVKSTLDDAGMVQSIKAARNAKSRSRNLNRAFHAGWQPPSIMNYVVAYAGPEKMTTVFDWLGKYHIKHQIQIETDKERTSRPSPSLDGIFVLGKGFIKFDNSPLSVLPADVRQSDASINWVIVDNERHILLTLFLSLVEATSNTEGAWLKAEKYLENVRFPITGWC
ncbi:DUF6602 domain-containing protein [Chromohalobacter israelensis]|uniref:DUF6602 domain-containing protein n=1 Tax=Chromohalobacter israelensis TaxID=141390 RepID=UPI000D717042|nr:DUF6602 domain-containing protein [Chromohalobacter salexigens]PWW31556.1 hypothetical protein DFO74_1433 [Chromohalobacter salexigens]